MAEVTEEILSYIRVPTEEDIATLPKFSYSSMDVFKKCPLNYKFRYVDGKRQNIDTLPLNIGTLMHRVLEEKGKMIVKGKIDYELLNEMIENGVEAENIAGVEALKKTYFEDWYKPDNRSSLTYPQKVEIFKTKVLPIEMENSEWIPIEFEKEFKFVFNNKAILYGFIDRIDTKTTENGKEFRVVDYKTSKKVFEEKDTKTALQMFVYALAVASIYKKLPSEFLYRFILIDKSQSAMTKGWEYRGIKSLTNILEKVEENKEKKIWKPNPNQLCYWCDYNKQNPNAGEFKRECQYYSLWTPNNKVYTKNKKWNEQEALLPKRRLIF